MSFSENKKKYLSAAAGLAVAGAIVFIGFASELPQTGMNLNSFLGETRDLQSSKQVDEAFLTYIQRYNRDYKSNSEYSKRKKQFQSNLKAI
jgi:Sec-independent protein translocase protein TatA